MQQSRTVHAPELRDLNDRLAKIAVTRNALKKETNGVRPFSFNKNKIFTANIVIQAEDTLKEEDLGRKKMMDAIAVAENTLEKLEKKCDPFYSNSEILFYFLSHYYILYFCYAASV